MTEEFPKQGQEPKIDKPLTSHDRLGNEYEGGKVVEGVQPEDFDSEEPLTTDDEGHLIRGARLKNKAE